MIELSDYDDMIRKLAWGCFRRLPQSQTQWTLEELEQEGRAEFTKLLRRRLRPDGAKFSTLLYQVLINRYQKIIRSVYAQKRNHQEGFVQFDGEGLVARPLNEGKSQQELLEWKQVFDYLRFFDSRLADFFLYGPSEDMMRFAKERAEQIAKEKGLTKPSKTVIGVKVIEEYFGCRLKDIVNSFKIGRLKINRWPE